MTGFSFHLNGGGRLPAAGLFFAPQSCDIIITMYDICEGFFMEKTNVMRLLEQKTIPYKSHTYEPDATKSGEEIAALLNEDADRVFKTLVTQAKSGAYVVFVIPVNGELNLKKAASAAGEKALSMIKQKELLPLTGYVHGGCSPIGMKKPYPTFFHETAERYDTIYFSAGKVGYQVEVRLSDLSPLLSYKLADVV